MSQSLLLRPCYRHGCSLQTDLSLASLYGLFQLPGDYPLEGDNFDPFSNAFLFEEAVEG